MFTKIGQFFKQIDFSGRSISDYLLILAGALVQALAMRFFLVPANLVSGGISGLAQLLHYTLGWPIGLVTLLGNLPLFILGWRYLGGPRFALRTILTIASFSLFTDLLMSYTGSVTITNDVLLNTLYGGIVMGAGLGLVYLGRGTSGGMDIVTRILNKRLGMPISLSYMVTDSVVVLSAGYFLSWEKALYGLIMIFLSSIAAEYVSQGTNVIREAIIISYESEKVIQAISDELERGTTIINARGGYSGADRPMIYCVVTSAEVIRLKTLVHDIDPLAFMVVGHANEALGEGFSPLSEK